MGRNELIIAAMRNKWFADHLYQGSSDDIQSAEAIAEIERCNAERRRRFDNQTWRIIDGTSSMLFPTHPDELDL